MRILSKATITSAAVLLVAMTANAQNAHFVTGPTATLGSNGDDGTPADPKGSDLVVSWKEAGLGNNVTANYIASANGTATYACINGGGNHPSASNKETVNGPVSASGTFTSGKNGSISASLTVEEPGPGAFSCPPGQTFILAFVAYSNISLADISFNDSAAATPSSLSACFVSGDLATALCQ